MSDANVDIKKNSELINIVKKADNYFNEISNLIDVPKEWNLKNSYELEVKKSYLRGLIRYSPESFEIVKFIKNNFQLKFPEKKQISWISLPYPMIHFPNDESENGGYHCDDYNNVRRKDWFTCWVPITNYEYPSVSVMNYQNIFIDYFSSFFIKLKLCKFFSSDFHAGQGNIFFWNGRLIHRGNLNTSKRPACAIQLKLTTNVYEHEQSRNFENLEFAGNSFYKLGSDEIISDFSNYKSALDDLLIPNSNENNNKPDYELFEKFINHFNNKSLHLSFALSTLNQRFISKKDLFSSININKSIIKVLDMSSLILGSSNLYSLQRLVNKKSEESKKKIIDKLSLLDKFDSIPFESFQYSKIVNPGARYSDKEEFSY